MLVTRVGGMACAFPIAHVVETMRPMPIAPFAGSGEHAPAVVEGVAMIRGAPVPVVDARKLLGVAAERTTRFVIVRAADRRIALVVDAVIEVTLIELPTLARLPALLGGAHRDIISAIGGRDAELLVVLDAARVLSADSWRALEGGSRPAGHGHPADQGIRR